MTVDPFVLQKFSLLVLRSDMFFPDSRPLMINTVRALRDPGQLKPNPAQRSSWIPLYSQSPLAFPVTSSGRSFYDFDFISLRQPQEFPSVFALLVNANSKLHNITGLTGSVSNPALLQFAHVVTEAVAAIFHVPKEVLDQTPSLIPTVPALPSAHYSRVRTPGMSSGSGREGNVHEGQHPIDLERQESGVVEEGGDNVEDHDFEEDNEPDTINGLTFSEMRTILQRVSGSTMSDSERGEAAMLMLGMAGGEPLLICTTLLFLISGARPSTPPGALSIDHKSRIGSPCGCG